MQETSTPKTDKLLRDQAQEMFSGDLAAAVTEEIDRKGADGAGGVFESVFTAYQGDRLFDALEPGELIGRPTLTWVGMDEFVFVPDRTAPFAYRTSAALGGRLITPGLMRTDGGSIPRVLRGHTRFSSWGYAPAFLIHDWIFHAKKAQVTTEHSWTFEESADVLGEIMRTMMTREYRRAGGQIDVGGYVDFSGRRRFLEKAEDTLFLIHTAVRSFVARDLWDDDSTAWSAPYA